MYYKNASVQPSGSPKFQNCKLRQCIQRELDLIGINPQVAGYNYLTDSIAMVYHKPESKLSCILAAKYKKIPSSVERAMQHAINSAWKYTDIGDLLKYYTARIRSDKGVLTTMELVYYYANRIQNQI